MLHPTPLDRHGRAHSPLDGRFAPKVTPDYHYAFHLLAANGLSARAIAARTGFHHSTVAKALRTPPDPVLARAYRDPEVRDLLGLDAPEEP